MRERVLDILTQTGLQLPNGISLVSACDQMLAFLAEWKKWSGKIDLTSEDDAQSVLEKHIFDSLQYARALRQEGRTMDIGSGAGFPGIPLKIVYPEMKMVLVESRRKRANYLKTVVSALSLKNIEVINARAEELAEREEYCNQFDQVIFKAVGPLQKCMEWGWPFLKDGGRLVVKKEPDADTSSLKDSNQFTLLEKMPIKNRAGISSEILVFGKCST